MEDRKDRIIQFDQLNPFGKAIFLTGAAVHATAGLIDVALRRTAGIAADAERAFKQGLDPNVEEAKILDEHEFGKGKRAEGDGK